MYVNVAFSCFYFPHNRKTQRIQNQSECRRITLSKEAGGTGVPESVATTPRTPPRLCSASPHPWGGRLPLREAGGLETLTGLTAKRNFKGEGGQTKGKKCTFSEHLCDEE